MERGRKFMSKEKYICVGSTALRAPDGSFLPSVPLYIKVEEIAGDNGDGITTGETEHYNDIGASLLPLYKNYINGVKLFEKETRSGGAL